MADQAKLTPKQQAFVAEYLVDLDATKAAIRAGYSDKTAGQIGFQLLQKTSIQEAITAAQQTRQQRTEITADQVIKELARVAFSDMREFAEWGKDGVRLKDSATLPAAVAACVSEVSETTSQTGGSLKFKLHSKTQALELLGRHLGLFPNKHEHSIADTDEQRSRIAGLLATLRQQGTNGSGRAMAPPATPSS